MKDYRKGKIYKIISTTSDKIYIGSTIQLLCERMRCHRSKKNTCSSSLLGDIKDLYIILICNYYCNNKEELRMEEERHIQLYKKNGIDVVNKRPACVTEEQKKEYIEKYNKEYYKKKHLELSEKNKEYYKKHSEKKKEYAIEYYKKQPEIKKEYSKEYNKKNKQLISQKKKEYYKKNLTENKEKYTCLCGSSIQKKTKIIHEKSKKHIEYIAEHAI